MQDTKTHSTRTEAMLAMKTVVEKDRLDFPHLDAEIAAQHKAAREAAEDAGDDNSGERAVFSDSE